jgi:DNA-binding transcriptional LysR family regulator
MDRTHPLAGKRSINVRDLEGVPMILPSRDSASHTAIAQMFADEGITPHLSAETSYAMTMCLLAMQGAGAALVSPFAAMHLRRSGLAIKRFEPSLPIELMLLTALDSSPSRISSMFIERLKAAMPALRQQWG